MAFDCFALFDLRCLQQRQTDPAWDFAAGGFAFDNASSFSDTGGTAASDRAGSGQISAHARRFD